MQNLTLPVDPVFYLLAVFVRGRVVTQNLNCYFSILQIETERHVLVRYISPQDIFMCCLQVKMFENDDNHFVNA